MKAFIIVILFLISSSTYAKDIDGAFGIKFNSVEKKDLGTSKKIPFVPEEGYEFLMFKNYFYSITPKSNKVYVITAEGDIINGCNKDLGIISKIIKNKYEIQPSKSVTRIKYEKEGEIISDFLTTYTFRKSDKQILLSCDPEDSLIVITYMDIDTAMKAASENDTIVDKNIDKKIKEMKKDDKYKTKGL